MIPSARPVKYCSGVKKILASPECAVYSAMVTAWSLMIQPTWTSAEVYMPAPKKKILPREL